MFIFVVETKNNTFSFVSLPSVSLPSDSYKHRSHRILFSRMSTHNNNSNMSWPQIPIPVATFPCQFCRHNPLPMDQPCDADNDSKKGPCTNCWRANLQCCQIILPTEDNPATKLTIFRPALPDTHGLCVIRDLLIHRLRHRTFGAAYLEYYYGAYTNQRGTHPMKYFCLPVAREDESHEFRGFVEQNVISNPMMLRWTIEHVLPLVIPHEHQTQIATGTEFDNADTVTHAADTAAWNDMEAAGNLNEFAGISGPPMLPEITEEE